jgi:hypothetical protein
MSSEEFAIIDERRQSGRVSSWNEYLCLQRLRINEFEISVCGYEILGERDAYYNEESDEFDLPETIDGKLVVAIEDEWVVGGSLVNHSDELMPLRFGREEVDGLIVWLKDANWYSDTLLGKVIDFMTH